MSRKPKGQPTRRERLTRQTRLRFNRVLSGISELARNLALVFVGTPLIEPLLRPAVQIAIPGAPISFAIGLALVSLSIILDWRQRE